MSVLDETPIHDRINPKSGRIIYLLGFLVLFVGATFFAILLIDTSDSLWPALILILSIIGIAWQFDMLKKRDEFSKSNSSTVGEVLSVHKKREVESDSMGSFSVFYEYRIVVRFEVDEREIRLRVNVNKDVYEK
jgi:hypothetical protein